MPRRARGSGSGTAEGESMEPEKSRFETDENIWTGLACLKANPKAKDFRRFGDGKRTYVNVVAWAKSQSEFKEKVRRHTDGEPST